MPRWLRWGIRIVLFGGALFLASRVQADWDADTDHRRAILETVGAIVLAAPLLVRLRWRSSD